MGELPFDALDQRLERPRRPDEQSLRARPQSLRLELRTRSSRCRRISAPSAIGTETDGSIVCPSAANGLVGIKPTVGLVSRTGIIPISHSRTPPGRWPAPSPTRRCCWARWRASIPQIESPPTPRRSPRRDYTRSLDADGLKGARIGIARKRYFGYSRGDRRADRRRHRAA